MPALVAVSFSHSYFAFQGMHIPNLYLYLSATSGIVRARVGSTNRRISVVPVDGAHYAPVQ